MSMFVSLWRQTEKMFGVHGNLTVGFGSSEIPWANRRFSFGCREFNIQDISVMSSLWDRGYSNFGSRRGRDIGFITSSCGDNMFIYS